MHVKPKIFLIPKDLKLENFDDYGNYAKIKNQYSISERVFLIKFNELRFWQDSLNLDVSLTNSMMSCWKESCTKDELDEIQNIIYIMTQSVNVNKYIKEYFSDNISLEENFFTLSLNCNCSAVNIIVDETFNICLKTNLCKFKQLLNSIVSELNKVLPYNEVIKKYPSITLPYITTLTTEV